MIAPLLRRWSARSAEAREVLVRFQGVAQNFDALRQVFERYSGFDSLRGDQWSGLLGSQALR